MVDGSLMTRARYPARQARRTEGELARAAKQEQAEMTDRDASLAYFAVSLLPTVTTHSKPLPVVTKTMDLHIF
jgi:hypothetical protein